MSEDKAMKYCYDYLDLVELVRYYDINTYEKIFGYGGRHGHLKLMIDRKVTKLISEDLILVNTELQAKLDKAVEALSNSIDVADLYYGVALSHRDSFNCYCKFCQDNKHKTKLNTARATLKELGVE